MKPNWMVKLDMVESSLTAALAEAGVGPEAAFLIGMRWSSFRAALIDNNKEEASMRMVQLCKRLDDAGVPSEPWAETLASCAWATN